MKPSHLTSIAVAEHSRKRPPWWKLRDRLASSRSPGPQVHNLKRNISLSPVLKSDLDAALFSFKCFAAAILAMYLSLRLGLTRPFWALGTVYLVSQPFSGMSVSRGLFRFLGTVGGAAATVFLVPTFVNEPMALSVALALWVGFCLYIARLDRTPRAYAFQLAGYTTSLIGFPYLMNPDGIFNIASVRVQEITIGILCATLVHGLIFPRRVLRRVQARVACMLADSERWTHDMLGAAREAVLSKDRARAAVDLLDLHLLSVHLPFDTVNGPVQTQILRALSGRFLDVLSLSGAIDDTLMELRSSPRGIPLDVVSLFEHVRSSLDALDKALDWAATEALLERLRGSLPVMSRVPDWTDLLMKNLASDIVDLALAHQDCRLLEHEFTTARSQWKRHFPARLHGSKSGYIFHRDRGLAVRSALGAAIGIIVSCALWIWTAWPDGATALSLVGVSGALFGTTDQPAGNFMRLLIGAVGGVAVGLLYGFVILPRTPDFVSLAAVIAPALLLIGSLLARPQYAFSALGVVLIFPIIAGLGPTNASDFSSAINGVVAIAIGSAMTVISLLLFQTIGMDHGTARILAAIRRDVAGRANGRTADMPRWTSRMMDRIGLLVPRLAGHNQSSQLLRHALADVRIGNAAGELWVLEKKIHYREAQSCLVSFLDALAAYYRKPKSAGVESLRGRLDLVMAAVIVDTSSVRECVLALLSDLRRDLSSRASSHEK